MIRTEALSRPIPGIRVDRELLAWAGVVVLAAMLRFRELGARPLDPDEARVALEAFRGVGFGRLWGSPESASPGYTGLMSLVFFLFGSSDAAARLVPALAGAALVSLPWLARPMLGHGGALGVAALLTMSPILVESARSAQSASLLTMLVLVVVVASARVLVSSERHETIAPGWFLALGVASAAGLATDPMFALHVLGSAAACVFAFDITLIRARLSELRRVPAWPVLLSFALTLILYTTRGLNNPGGLQTGLIDALWTWAPELLQPARAPVAPLMVLIGTECLIVVAAIGGALGVGKATALERFAAAWTAIAVAIAIIGGRVDYRLLAPAALAAAMLGGPWLARVLQHQRWRDPMTYLVAGVAAVPLVAALIASLPALRQGNGQPTQVHMAALAGLAGTIVGGVALVGRRTTTDGLLCLALAAAVLGTFTGAARLSASTNTDLGRAGPGAVFTDELREVERQLAIWEWDQDRRPILADERLRQPLGWVLRSNRNITWTTPDEIRSGPAVTLGSARGDTLPDGGLRVTVGYRFVGLSDLSPVRAAEWLLWRRSIPRVESYDILLYR
jgi:hypothetical protein